MRRGAASLLRRPPGLSATEEERGPARSAGPASTNRGGPAGTAAQEPSPSTRTPSTSSGASVWVGSKETGSTPSSAASIRFWPGVSPHATSTAMRLRGSSNVDATRSSAITSRNGRRMPFLAPGGSPPSGVSLIGRAPDSDAPRELHLSRGHPCPQRGGVAARRRPPGDRARPPRRGPGCQRDGEGSAGAALPDGVGERLALVLPARVRDRAPAAAGSHAPGAGAGAVHGAPQRASGHARDRRRGGQGVGVERRVRHARLGPRAVRGEVRRGPGGSRAAGGPTGGRRVRRRGDRDQRDPARAGDRPIPVLPGQGDGRPQRSAGTGVSQPAARTAGRTGRSSARVRGHARLSGRRPRPPRDPRGAGARAGPA